MEATNDGLELVGLVGIVDPPREEIPEVVCTLRRAGVKIYMVTGDFKLTAQAIAAECGIITNPADLVHDVSALSEGRAGQSIAHPDNLPSAETSVTSNTRSIVLSGPELTNLDEEQWDTLCQYDEIVFARTTPEQKLKIVEELQARDETIGSKLSKKLSIGVWTADKS